MDEQSVNARNAVEIYDTTLGYIPVCRKWICIFPSVRLCSVLETVFTGYYTRKRFSGIDAFAAESTNKQLG